MSCLHSPTRTNQVSRHSLTRLETERALVVKTFEKCGEKRGPQGPVQPPRSPRRERLRKKMLSRDSVLSRRRCCNRARQEASWEAHKAARKREQASLKTSRGEKLSAVLSSLLLAPSRSLVPSFLPSSLQARRQTTADRDAGKPVREIETLPQPQTRPRPQTETQADVTEPLALPSADWRREVGGSHKSVMIVLFRQA